MLRPQQERNGSRAEVQRVVRGEREWGNEVSKGVRQWVSVTARERERGSKVRPGPASIYKSSGRDKNVRVIIHLVCQLWFMEWDRNWLTKRKATLPSLHHTQAYVLGCLYTEQAADWALWACSTSQQKACCLPLSCSPLSVTLLCLSGVSLRLSVRRSYIT